MRCAHQYWEVGSPEVCEKQMGNSCPHKLAAMIVFTKKPSLQMGKIALDYEGLVVLNFLYCCYVFSCSLKQATVLGCFVDPM